MTTAEIQIRLEKLFAEDGPSDYILDRITEQRDCLLKFVDDVTDDQIRWRKSGKLTVPRPIVKSRIEKLYAAIIASIEDYVNGRFDRCRENIYNSFITPEEIREIKSCFSTTVQDPSKTLFYRIRRSDTYSLFKRNEMFHIPFEKRGIVENQRFSISGYPCLYLGSSVYGCWEATQRPNIDMCNIIALRPTRKLKFLNLSIPTIKEGVGIYANLLYSLVLRLACSLKTKNISDNFKHEYIIPQAVLESIIRRNGESSNGSFDGIKYTSSIYLQSQDMFKDKELLGNYVLPIRASKKDGLCNTLVSLFDMTEATSFIAERLKKNAKTVFVYSREEHKNAYGNTEFGMLEEKLNNREFLKIDK